MTILVALLVAVFDPGRIADLAAGARAAAPAYLTADTALEHAEAAIVAGELEGVDPALLLSIAWHESRYEVAAVTPEVGGKISCGVMTPVPQARCAHETLLASYLAGAHHLRTWLDAMHGDVHAALTGYAGGYHLIGLCRAGRELAGCHVADVFLARARVIAAHAGA